MILPTQDYNFNLFKEDQWTYIDSTLIVNISKSSLIGLNHCDPYLERISDNVQNLLILNHNDSYRTQPTYLFLFYAEMCLELPIVIIILFQILIQILYVHMYMSRKVGLKIHTYLSSGWRMRDTLWNFIWPRRWKDTNGAEGETNKSKW